MKFVYPVVAVAALLASAVDAFRIESTKAAPPADILGEHQELERTWTVYSSESLEKLHITVPGPVFIGVAGSVFVTEPTPEPTTVEPTTEEPTTEEPTTEAPAPTPAVTQVEEEVEDADGSYDGSSSSSGSGSGSSAFDTIEFPSGAVSLSHKKEKKVATIVVSGNSSALLELLELVALKKGEDNGLRIHLKNTDAQVEGYVLTTIDLVEKHAVRHLSTAIASSVAVADGVLVTKNTEKKIKISSAGATDVLIAQQSDMHVNDFVVDVAGSGSVQLLAAGIKVNSDISVSVAGDGQIAVHCDSLKAEELKTTLSGSGNVFVEAKTLQVEELTTAVYGEAVASFHVTESGVAKTHSLTVAGAGAVYAGSIVVQDTDADIWGSGVAYVQTTDKIKASTSWSGSVFYVGVEPAKIKTSGWFFWRKAVARAEKDQVLIHEAENSPPVYPEHVSLVLTEATHSDEPMIVFEEESQSVTFAMVQSHLSAVANGPNGFVVFSSVAIALVAIAMMAHSYQQHRVRRHYTPLV